MKAHASLAIVTCEGYLYAFGEHRMQTDTSISGTDANNTLAVNGVAIYGRLGSGSDGFVLKSG